MEMVAFLLLRVEELENKLNEAKLDYEKSMADLEAKKKSYDSIK
jgi:hypothetical protein